MPGPENKPGLLQRVLTGLRDFQRGYTEQDILDNGRIYSGQITPEDRQAYREKKLEAATLALTINLRPSIDSSPSLYIASLLSSGYAKQLSGVQDMSDGEIDMILIKRAAGNLMRWHRIT